MNLDSTEFSALDRQFGEFLMRRYKATPELATVAGLVSRAYRQGDTGMEWEVLQSEGAQVGAIAQLSDLETSPAVAKLDAQGQLVERCPLTWDGHALALTRPWIEENRLATVLQARTQLQIRQPGPKVLAIAKQLFGDLTSEGRFQAAGAFLPFFFRLAMITGGPGTGKTTVLAKLLALQFLHAEEQGQPCPKLALTAPTGKAAQRMAEALKTAVERFPPAIYDRLAPLFSPILPLTLHRLLGLNDALSEGRFNQESPLEADLVIVDEASMIDLSLMDKLLSALAPSTTLILLGDRNQLPSVDPGRVLADLAEFYPPNRFTHEFVALVGQALGDSSQLTSNANQLSPLVELTHSYRFDDHGGIGCLAGAILQGDTDKTAKALKTGAPEVFLHSPLRNYSTLLAGWEPFLLAADPETALAQLAKFMVLCVTNDGPQGQLALNESLLTLSKAHGKWPVLILRNSPMQGLFNGDLGVVMTSESVPHAYFMTPSGETRSYLLSQLPEHSSAFAVTVHKAQGSEFDRVVVVLPDMVANFPPVLGRELLYTAVTRARNRLDLYANPLALDWAVSHHTPRYSGMVRRLGARAATSQ